MDLANSFWVRAAGVLMKSTWFRVFEQSDRVYYANEGCAPVHGFGFNCLFGTVGSYFEMR